MCLSLLPDVERGFDHANCRRIKLNTGLVKTKSQSALPKPRSTANGTLTVVASRAYGGV